MAPRQSLSRGAPKKVAKNFASKAVKNVLDSLIESKIKTTLHNQKTLSKWTSKMKSSILKKLSEASKVAFTPTEMSKENLRAEIEATKTKIQQQMDSIKQRAIEEMKSSALAIIEPGQAALNGRFDVQAEKIKDQFGEIAVQLSTNLADISGCVQSLKSSIDATDVDWKQISLQLEANMSTKTRSQTTKESSGRSAEKFSAQVLYNHLGQY